ncbi:glycosyltransferase family 4 protein [Salinibacter ruber]|nr:glycosyltransferase family 4 protein [Salinibacter ruber]
MEIGVVTAHFPPEASAAAVRLGPFVEAWASRESCMVHVFAPRSKSDASEPYANNPNIRVHRVPVRIAENTRSLPIRLLSEVIFCLATFGYALRKDVDVYVTSSPPFLLALTTLLLARSKKTPYVLDIRDLYPEMLFTFEVIEPGSVFGRLLVQLERWLYDSALFVTGVTEGICSHIHDCTDGDVVLVRNGIDTGHFRRTDDRDSKAQGPNSPSSSDKFIVLFHGILGRAQNVELLLQYASYLKQHEIEDVIVRIVGDGPKRDVLEEGVKRRGLEQIVDFVGYVDFEHIPAYVNQADIGFSPRVDGVAGEIAFPVKVYECLGCGVPMIVTPKSEAGEFVEENDVGAQHSNDDIEGIHRSIMRLKENSQLYQSYSERATQVATHFDRHKLGHKLFDRIKSSLDREVGASK